MLQEKMGRRKLKNFFRLPPSHLLNQLFLCPYILTFSPVTMNDLSVLLAKASPFSCALASIFASQLKTMDLGNLPSLSYIIIFSTASFPSACKHADVFPTLKKEILS